MQTIAQFKIDYHQYLNEESALIHPLPITITNERLVKLYKTMLLTRTFDQKAISLQRTGKLGTYAPSLGQEAVGVGIGAALKKTDVFVPYYRDNGTLLQRDIGMDEILLYWGGDERGNNFKNNKEDFPICVPIATQSLHAAGVASAIKYRKEKRAVATTIGEGGTSKGDFYEALNVAGAWRLPIVFIVNNNQWAISVPRSSQTSAQTIAQKAIAAGIPCLQVDGNDVIAVETEVHKALERARQNKGPTLIEAITYRLCDHTTADDASRYCSKNSLQEAHTKEPVGRLKKYLLNERLWDEEKEKAWLSQCKQDVDNAVSAYLNVPKPQIGDLFDYLYATLPAALEEQREFAIAVGEL